MKIMLILLAVVAGICMPVQAGINNTLRHWTNHTVVAACISFAVGTLALLVYILLMRIPWPHMNTIGQTRVWEWSGGLLGAFFVSVTIFLAPRLGATTMLSLVLAGQMVASLLLDHFGLLGFPVRPITLTRIVGVALLVAGVMLVRKI